MNRMFLTVVIGFVLVLQTGCLAQNCYGNAPAECRAFLEKHGKAETRPASFNGNGKDAETMYYIEALKAILECGFPDPDSIGTENEISREEVILVERCVKKSGFRFIGKMICDDEKSHPLCLLPESRIPDRSVEWRLNSPYCKARPKLLTEQERTLCTR